MGDPDDVIISAKVSQYNIPRLRFGQLLLPVAVVASVLARREPSGLTVGLAFASQGIGLALLLSAVKRLGWQPLHFGGGRVEVGSTGLMIDRIKVHQWTFLRRTARLYGVRESFRLDAPPGTEQALAALLRSQFGSPLTLVRRGSPRARFLALGIGLCGLVVSILAIANDSRLLAIVGAPAFVLGTATFGALSQRQTG